MLVVSLTTVPPRFGRLGHTLETLLAQTRPPDRIVVNVPRRYSRFPDHDGTLPPVPAGVERRVVARDLGPATKVGPTLGALAAGDRLIYCDDDCAYAPAWTARLLAAARAHPEAAIAGSGFDVEMLGLRPAGRRLAPRLRLHAPGQVLREGRKTHVPRPLAARPDASPRAPAGRSGYVDIAQGFAGVLVRAGQLPEAAQVPPACRAVDDIWLSGLLAAAGVPIWRADPVRRACRVDPDAAAALQDAAAEGRTRAAANAACAAHLRDRFGVWR